MAAFPRPTALAVSLVLLSGGCSGDGEAATSTPPASSPAVSSSAPASTGTPVPEPALRTTPGNPSYEVALRGNGDGTRWRGTQAVSFVNTGDETLQRIWLRTWANGVQGCEPLAIDVSAPVGGELGRPRLDCTALPVSLTEPLEPGERTRIGFDLSITVPERNDRFGYHAGASLLGNAIPTLAVRDDAGWHLDPYVDLGESFYSVVGRYRVSLTTRAALHTPSTGSLVSTDDHGDRVTRTYVARDVRDYAWAAGEFASIRGEVDGVDVTVWYRPSFMTTSGARITLRDAVRSMEAYGQAFGAYPYPAVDVVTAAFTTFRGMEYPRLIFTNPERPVIAHELAHQWWYGIVGNDQFTAPWLDESFAMWASTLPWSPWERCPSYDWPSAEARLTNDMAYWGEHPSEYVTIYEGGGCMLADLADRFGLRRFTALLRDHAAAHWFGVVTTADFQRRIERAAELHLAAFDAAAYWETWRIE